VAGPAILPSRGLQALVDALLARGYRVLGPQVRDGAVVLADLTDIDALPLGVGDEQAPGHYRLREGGAERAFGFAATAQSPKSVLFPPDELLWRGRRTDDGFSVEPASPADDPDHRPVAILGARGCDVAAIAVQDRVLLGREHVDAHYAARRAGAFLVAVTCSDPAGTCFCASVGTGPRPRAGSDLVLTELADPHRYLVEAGTPAGQALLGALDTTPATPDDLAAADELVADATARMGRTMRTDDLPELLNASAESPRWAAIAERCLACTNCTAVCPTCFCTGVQDVGDLTGALDERHRVWDSCFSQPYSYIHGGAVRTWTASRYRQWLTHKLATWTEQFGTSGCVGCGRCITWCPAGIDLTAEVATIRELAEAHDAVAAGAPGGAPTDGGAPTPGGLR
jgi:ferredoxin